MITPLVAETLGLGIIAGLAACGLIYALVPQEVTAARQLKAQRRARARRRLATRTLIALVVGLLTAIATGWPVAGLGATALVVGWDKVAGGIGAERTASARVEALATWVETLRDTMAGSAGLEQAIPAAARAAPPLLAGPLTTMVEQLRSRTPLTDALQNLADELDDPTADTIIASLILNAELRGPGLHNVLTGLALSAREEVSMRERITAQRAQSRRGVQIIVITTVVFIGFTAVFDHDFVSAYDSALGEIVLALILGVFAAAFTWMRRLAHVEVGGRILQRPAPTEPEEDQA